MRIVEITPTPFINSCVSLLVVASATTWAADPSIGGRSSTGQGVGTGHGYGHASPGIPGLPPSAIPQSGPGGVPSGGPGGGCAPNCNQGQFFLPPVPVYELDEQKRQIGSLLAVIKAGQDYRSRAKDIDAAINILAARWAIVLSDPRNQYDRTQLIYRAKADLQGLMNQVLEASIQKMTADTKRLTPFFWELSSSASEKREAIRQTEKDLKELDSRGSSEIYTSRTWNDGTDSPARREYSDRSGRPVLEYKPGPAMQQLKKINETKCWEPPSRCPK